MPFRVRKSVSIAGTRLNFGKNGLTSVSTGIRGFRITTSRQGTRVSVGIPGTGIRYTQRIDQPAPARPAQLAPNVPDQHTIQTADVAALSEVSSQDLLNRINKRASQFHLELLPAAAFLLALYPAYVVWEVLVVPVLIIGAAVTWWVRRIDTRSRTTHLHYELDEQVTQQHTAIQGSLHALAQAQALWRVISHQSADWKQHAGASSLISRNRSLVDKAKPPYITTNVPVPNIAVGPIKLFFFPDRLLVWQQGRYGVVSYESLMVSVDSVRFVEDGLVPGDATIIGQTWQHPNKSGGPDRRFSSNRQIPIARYGTLELTSPTGLNLHFQVSSCELARQFAEILRTTACQVRTSL